MAEQRRFETDLTTCSDKCKILDDYVQDKNILHDQNRRTHTPFKSSMRNHGKWWPNWTATLLIIQELNPSRYEIKVFPFWNNAMNYGMDIILLYTQRNKLTRHTKLEKWFKGNMNPLSCEFNINHFDFFWKNVQGLSLLKILTWFSMMPNWTNKRKSTMSSPHHP